MVDDDAQIAFSLLRAPADEMIARLYLPGARAEIQGGDDVACGTDKVAQLRAGRQLMSQIMMAFDIYVPQQRFGFGADEIKLKGGEFDGGYVRRLENRLLDVRIRPVDGGLWISRRRQCEQAIGLHAQHGHPTAHVFEPAVGSPPVQPLTHFARESGASQGRSLGEQSMNELELRSGQVSSAVQHRSARIDQARLAGGPQGDHRFVQTDPAAPNDRHAGHAIALAPAVTAETAEHAYRFAQARGFCGWQRAMHTNLQRLDLLGGEHFDGRHVRLHTREVGDMNQSHPDDAEERAVAAETCSGLEQAFLYLAAGLEDFVPSLYAPASRIPLTLLDRAVEIWHGQIGEQDPANRLLPFGRIGLGGRNHLHSDRLRGTRGLGGSASLGRFERDRREAHLNLRGTCFALAVAGNLHREGAEHPGAGIGVQNAVKAPTLLGHEQAIGACANEKTRALLSGIREKLEDIRFPSRHRDDRRAARRALYCLSQCLQPLRTLLLFDRCALQALDRLLIAFVGNLPARPDVLTQQAQRYARRCKRQRVMHDQAPIVLTVAVADRPNASGLRMVAVAEKYGVLHVQHWAAHGKHALDRGLQLRGENRLWSRLAVVERTVRCLRARPIPTGFIDRRAGRARQLFGGLDQAAIQAFVRQIGADELRADPLDRRRTGFDDSLNLGILAARARQAGRYLRRPSRRRENSQMSAAVSSAAYAGAPAGCAKLKICVE